MKKRKPTLPSLLPPVEVLLALRRQASAEATVALSHEVDCQCSVCQRVRARNVPAQPSQAPSTSQTKSSNDG